MWDFLPCIDLLLVAWSDMGAEGIASPNDGGVPKASLSPNDGGAPKASHSSNHEACRTTLSPHFYFLEGCRRHRSRLMMAVAPNNDAVPKAYLAPNDGGVPEASLGPNDDGVPKERAKELELGH
ncbi:unnamed protein product [Prunus armeniaca]